MLCKKKKNTSRDRHMFFYAFLLHSEIFQHADKVKLNDGELIVPLYMN